MRAMVKRDSHTSLSHAENAKVANQGLETEYSCIEGSVGLVYGQLRSYHSYYARLCKEIRLHAHG